MAFRTASTSPVCAALTQARLMAAEAAVVALGMVALGAFLAVAGLLVLATMPAREDWRQPPKETLQVMDGQQLLDQTPTRTKYPTSS